MDSALHYSIGNNCRCISTAPSLHTAPPQQVALGVQPAAAGASEADADIELLPLEELQAAHAEDAVFVDLYHTGA